MYEIPIELSSLMNLSVTVGLEYSWCFEHLLYGGFKTPNLDAAAGVPLKVVIWNGGFKLHYRTVESALMVFQTPVVVMSSTIMRELSSR